MAQGTLGMNANGCAAVVAIDDDTTALVDIGTAHYYIHEDAAFGFTYTSSAATTASAGIVFITGTKESHLRLASAQSSRDKLLVTLLESQSASGITSSGGWSSSAYSVNRNRATQTTLSNIKWYESDSGAILDASATTLETYFIGGGSALGAGGVKSGGSSAADEEFVLAPSSLYAVKWRNDSSATNAFSLRFFHYDI